ncbi:type II toxin-antitoxin system RelE family toxin [Microbacterium sp. NPDC055903]
MTAYAVEFTTAAARELRKLDQQIRRRVLAAAEGLSSDPRPVGARKLSGLDAAWRIRVGDYRILYEIADELVLVTVNGVGHRRAVHERL